MLKKPTHTAFDRMWKKKTNSTKVNDFSCNSKKLLHFSRVTVSLTMSMKRPTLKLLNQTQGHRFASGHVIDGALHKRPLKKIGLGKARPAIYYKFNCATEYSDGAVVIRRSQYPKDELRLIQDMRNSPLWNSTRTDLEVVDANAGGRLEKFKQKFAQFAVKEDTEETSKPSSVDSKNKTEKKSETKEASAKETEEPVKEAKSEGDGFMLDDYLELLGQNVQEVQKGGKLAVKQKGKKK